MKKPAFQYFTLFLIVSGLFLLSNCKKAKNSEALNKNTSAIYYQPAIDDAEAESYVLQIFESSYAKSTSYYQTYGFTDTITFASNFSINHSLISGRIVVNNRLKFDKKGHSPIIQKSSKDVNNSWEINAQNLIITHSNGKKIYFNCDLFCIKNFTDNSDTIRGTSEGTDINGIFYTSAIESKYPLMKINDCTHIIAGLASYFVEGKLGFYIDYGACDNLADVYVQTQINSNKYTHYSITIP